MQDRSFTLNPDNLANLDTFGEVLKKDNSTMINEALEQYFQNVQKALLEKKLEEENSQTNLDFNEFWEDVDI